MPGYGTLPATEGTGLLPWSWAEERLVASRNYWMVTVWPDGTPHAMPVWGMWQGDAQLPGRGHRADKSMVNCMTVFEAAGGAETFKTLVERFYAGVASDPVLRRVYPEEDLSGATERLTLFLIQYWGGPDTYSARRGHPRLRLRHQPFGIGQIERDAWLGHMKAAVESLELSPEVRKELLDYFETTSTAMINQPTQL